MSAAPRGEPRPLSVAPMMDRTDRHFRWFLRRLTRRTLLYTEMITTGAILHGDRERLLGHDDEERPLALQLGGDDPAALAASARIAEEFGYDEVDLNVGCPSDRVREGSFGVCLMGRPAHVAECVGAMRAATGLPVTVKHRIGYDDLDRYDDMLAFVDVVARAGADRFVVHARKAWLGGLSPKENRTVPPLRYDDVYRLKRERPDLRVEINGGITRDAIAGHLEHVDGVMLGRAAYDDPYSLAGVDAEVFGEAGTSAPSREDVVAAMLPYLERVVARGEPVHRVTRHLLGLFAGRPGARAWRRRLTEDAAKPGAGVDVLVEALRERGERVTP